MFSSFYTLKPVFHGACFEADSAPTVSADFDAPGKALPGEDKAGFILRTPYVRNRNAQTNLHISRA